jgi:hypothetical protein
LEFPKILRRRIQPYRRSPGRSVYPARSARGPFGWGDNYLGACRNRSSIRPHLEFRWAIARRGCFGDERQNDTFPAHPKTSLRSFQVRHFCVCRLLSRSAGAPQPIDECSRSVLPCSRAHSCRWGTWCETTDSTCVDRPRRRVDSIICPHKGGSAIRWNALGYLLTRFIVPTRSLFPGWMSLPRVSHFSLGAQSTGPPTLIDTARFNPSIRVEG